MSINSLRASLELLDTSPGVQSSFSSPARTIYHQIARDVTLIQGIHYAVEEALANVGELASLDSRDPCRRCILRLQQNLIDITRISENVQERMLHNITNHASTSQAQVVEEEPTPQQITKPCGSVPLPTTSFPGNSRIEDSGQVIMFRPEPLPSENLMPLYAQATLSDRRSKRKASDEDDDNTPQPPAAKRPRRDPGGSIHLRPTCRKGEERSSVFGWARRMFPRSRK